MKTSTIPGISTPVTRLCLGTGSFGSAYSRDDSFALMDTFAARGGTFLDTAHIYAAWLPQGEGQSERTIGAWLRSRGMTGRMVVGSKGGHPPLDNSVAARLRPDQISCDLTESLERLQQPTIDLYWLHRDDPQVPCAEILAVLDEHRRAGRIRAYGASNWTTGRLDESIREARRLRLPGFVASQIGWSLAAAVSARIPPGGMLFMDAPTLAWHRQSGMPVIAYSSQANGYFTKDQPPALYDTPENHRRKALVLALAQRHGCSANAVALAWLLGHPCAGGAIVGSRTVTQLEDSSQAEALMLTVAERLSLDP